MSRKRPGRVPSITWSDATPVVLPQARAVVTVSEHLAARARDSVFGATACTSCKRHRPSALSADESERARRRLSLPLDRDVVLFMGHLEEHKGSTI